MSGVRDYYNYSHPPSQGPWLMQSRVEYEKATPRNGSGWLRIQPNLPKKPDPLRGVSV